jgi:hypothetical protein
MRRKSTALEELSLVQVMGLSRERTETNSAHNLYKGSRVTKVALGTNDEVAKVAQTGELVNLKHVRGVLTGDKTYKVHNLLCMSVKDPLGKTIAVVQAVNKVWGEHFDMNDEHMLGECPPLRTTPPCMIVRA